MKPRVIVFAKDPVPGRVKTRLAATVGAETAALIYEALVYDLLQELMRESDRWDIEIHLDRHSKFYEHFPCPAKIQHGDDLGAKLLHSIGLALADQCPKVVILASDTPTLHASQVAALLAVDADVAAGPTCDGGYWGIAASDQRPEIFQGVRWSTEFALEDTRLAVERAGLRFATGPASWDLDDQNDLGRLLREGGAGLRTMAVVEGLRRRIEEDSGRLPHHG